MTLVNGVLRSDNVCSAFGFECSCISDLERRMCENLKKCKDCGDQIDCEPDRQYVLVLIFSDKPQSPEWHHYHVGCFLKNMKKGKFSNEIATRSSSSFLKMDNEGTDITLKCEVCKRAVVGSREQYTYFIHNTGKRGQERPAYFHNVCLLNILKVKSQLYRDLGEKVGTT